MKDAGQQVQIRLQRLKFEDAELVRAWRNSTAVQRHMVIREVISAEMQRAWFFSIDNDRNYYFLIKQSGQPIGVINLKNVDREKGIAESGIFFGVADGDHRAIVAFAAVFAVLDFAFNQLGLSRLEAQILKDNERATRYNKTLGYECNPGQDDRETLLYSLTRERYVRTTESMRSMVSRLVAVTIEL